MMFGLASAIRGGKSHTTVRELAKQTGVSPATISTVLNRKKGISEGTRKKVLDVIKVCQYMPPARRPKNGRNVSLVKYYKSGILVEENQELVSVVTDSTEEQLRVEQLGMTITMVKTDLKLALDSIDYNKYCGMFLIATEVMQDEFSAPDSVPIPFVAANNTVPNHCYSSVCMNNAENVYTALQYYKECGHIELGYPGSTTGVENPNEQHVTFLRYVKELSFQLNPKSEFRVKPTMLGAHDGLFRMPDQNPVLPSCFFAESDTTALGAMKVLKGKGYKIPNNVSLTGFDGIPYSSISSPTPATIRMQKKITGKQSVIQLMQLMEGPRFMPMKTQVAGKLVERPSVKHLT